MFEKEKALVTIRAVVADCLDLEEEDIKLESRLIDDLGADSLDFVDLLFSLEKKFGVKLREGELSFLARLDLSDPTVMKDGYLSAETILVLKNWLPEVSELENQGHVTPGQLFSLITVDTLLRMVERRFSVAGGSGAL